VLSEQEVPWKRGFSDWRFVRHCAQAASIARFWRRNYLPQKCQPCIQYVNLAQNFSLLKCSTCSQENLTDAHIISQRSPFLHSPQLPTSLETMQTMKRSLLLHSFILWNANLVIAKNEKTKERNLRVYGERSGESWDTYELQQIDMSMPTTAAPTTVPPTLSPSTTPTAAPTTAMPVDTPTTPAPTDATTLAPSSSPTLAPSSAPATSVETLPPTTAPTFPALFLDEDDEFIEFELVECQGGKTFHDDVFAFVTENSECKLTFGCFLKIATAIPIVTLDLFASKETWARKTFQLALEMQIFSAMALMTFASNHKRPILWWLSGMKIFQPLPFPWVNVKEVRILLPGVHNFQQLSQSNHPLFHFYITDCDEDGDCGDGLRCFQRDENESVPGCVGEGEFGWDYCFVPLPPLNFVGDFEMEYYQLQE
jgi:hypothetical protein